MLAVGAGQVVGILLLSPLGLAHPWILDRYLLPALPCALLGIAYAFAEGGWPRHSRVASAPGAGEDAEQREVEEAASRGAATLRGFAAAAFVALLLVAGPFADPGLRRSSFMHHDDMAGFYLPRAWLPPQAVPDFYGRLAAEGAEGDDGAVVEYPWLFLWRFRSFYIYQEIHGRRVLVATPQRLVRRPELALANAISAEPGAFCRSGARWLVVHLHVAREEDRVVRPEDKAPPALNRNLRRALRQQAGRMAADLERLWGPPSYADQDIEAWDLARACRGGGIAR